MIMAKLLFLFLMINLSSSQKTCSDCGAMRVPYPLSTSPLCGDPNYALRCDSKSQKLYFDALNGSSYLVLEILPLSSRLIIQPSPWLPGRCVTRDLQTSEGFWLNQSRPFRVTSSNTIFLFNCSPRLLLSPLNCTPTSLCHEYLKSSGRVDAEKSRQCAGGPSPCCYFVAGGMPSAYKIRLHSSGCRAFRSVLHLDPLKPATEWTEGLEIRWDPPPEPLCKTQLDCGKNSKCLASGTRESSRCFCDEDYFWDHLGACLRKSKRSLRRGLELKISIGVVLFLSLAATIVAITAKRAFQRVQQSKLAKTREDMLSRSNGGKPARTFRLKEVKKATNGFSRDRVLGSGGFGDVFRGELQDGTTVAVKLAKLGSLKSTQQVLNEVGILSQVNHKHLVRLLGCCIESEQPLLIYEYIPNGNLYEHLHGAREKSRFLDWKTRLKISVQTAEALAYLHSATCTPIYHRDVKPTNILLDSEFNVKVSDFGLSRLARPGISHVSTCAQGTLGYLDPEYHRNYQLTDKSDAYSYGVVMLEMITSKKAIDFSREDEEVNLAVYAERRMKNGDVMEVVDERLKGEEDEKVKKSMRVFGETALACVREKKSERPSMKDVVEALRLAGRILDGGEGSDGDVIAV